MTIAVSDSGPLTHLAQIDLGAALETLAVVHLSTQVVAEVRAYVALAQWEKLIQVHEVSPPEIAVQRAAVPSGTVLQIADLATLVLARRLSPELVLTADLALRRVIEAQGYTPMGSVGVLLWAYKRGMLDKAALDRAIDNLFVHSTLYLSPVFKTYVRGLIAEMTN